MVSDGDKQGFRKGHPRIWEGTARRLVGAGDRGMADAADFRGGSSGPVLVPSQGRHEVGIEELEGIAAEEALLRLRVDSNGARNRFISRVRGRLLRLVKRLGGRERDPLQDLEREFRSIASFVARNPAVAMRVMGWSMESGDARIRRRIGNIARDHETRLARLVDLARRQGHVGADVDPDAAARHLVAMIRDLAWGMPVDRRRPQRFLEESAKAYQVFLNDLRTQGRT